MKTRISVLPLGGDIFWVYCGPIWRTSSSCGCVKTNVFMETPFITCRSIDTRIVKLMDVGYLISTKYSFSYVWKKEDLILLRESVFRSSFNWFTCMWPYTLKLYSLFPANEAPKHAPTHRRAPFPLVIFNLPTAWRQQREEEVLRGEKAAGRWEGTTVRLSGGHISASGPQTEARVWTRGGWKGSPSARSIPRLWRKPDPPDVVTEAGRFLTHSLIMQPCRRWWEKERGGRLSIWSTPGLTCLSKQVWTEKLEAKEAPCGCFYLLDAKDASANPEKWAIWIMWCLLLFPYV